MVSPALIILLGFALFQKAIASGVALHPPGYLSACLLARDGNEDVRDWVEVSQLQACIQDNSHN